MKLILRDRNQGMVDAWNKQFVGVPNVEIGQGDIFDVPADAIISPANSFAYMNGGIDAIYTARFGQQLENRLQSLLNKKHYGELPVGQAEIIDIKKDGEPYKYLICAPTMHVPADVSGTINPYLAMRAVLILVSRNNGTVPNAPNRINSVLCPGLGTAIGRVPYDIAAFQMREAYRVVMENQPVSTSHLGEAWGRFEALRRGLPYKESP